MKMTKKQAAEYIEDRQNWRLIQDGEFVKVYRLDFGNRHYLDIVHKRIKEMIAVYTNKEVEVTFSGHAYYEYDIKHDCVGYSTRATHIVEEIWQEAKTL